MVAGQQRAATQGKRIGRRTVMPLTAGDRWAPERERGNRSKSAHRRLKRNQARHMCHIFRSGLSQQPAQPMLPLPLLTYSGSFFNPPQLLLPCHWRKREGLIREWGRWGLELNQQIEFSANLAKRNDEGMLASIRDFLGQRMSEPVRLTA
jgi:hypothetical protein